MKYPLSVLPLLVHGVETGSPRPAVPLSAVHVLWWTSACFLDDLADGPAELPAGPSTHEALLAAVVTGHVLPLKALGSRWVPESVRCALTAEILDCAITAAEGQLGDMRADVDHATRGSVVTAYRGKSGAPFGMITAMAAALAGAEAERIELWREFGCTFGILWQIFNDQEDITSGRNEDLSNGTVTYLFACALEAAPLESRERILDLHADARTSAASRSALTGLLLAPAVLRLYEEDISTFRGEASRSTRTTSVLRPGTTTTLPMADRDRQSTQAPACTARVRYANSCSTLLYRHRVARLTAATPPGAHWR